MHPLPTGGLKHISRLNNAERGKKSRKKVYRVGYQIK